MLDWLKKLVSGSQAKNVAGLPHALLQLLRTDLSRLDKSYPGLGEALLQYVVDGTSEEVLLRLGGLQDAAAILKLRNYDYSTQKAGRSAERRGLFDKIDQIPPIVLYRLGQVYAAAWSATPQAAWHWGHLSLEERWMEALLSEYLEIAAGGYYSHRDKERKYDIALLARASEAGGQSKSLPAKMIFMEEPSYSYVYFTRQTILGADKLAEYFIGETDTIREALQHAKAQHRSSILELLAKTRTPCNETLLHRVVELALDSSKTVREAAEMVIGVQTEEVRSKASGILREKITTGTPGERTYAIGLLSRQEGGGCTDFLIERLASETGKKVRSELEKYLGIQTLAADGSSGIYEDGLEAPEPLSFPTEYSLSAEQEEDFVAAVLRYAEAAVAEHGKTWDHTDPRWRRGKREVESPVDAKTARKMFRSLENDAATKNAAPLLRSNLYLPMLFRELGEFIERHDLDLVPVIRLAVGCGAIQDRKAGIGIYRYTILDDALEWINGVIQRRYPDLDLLDLASAFEAAGLDSEWVNVEYTSVRWNTKFNRLGLPDSAIWPFFLKNNSRLKVALGLMAPAEKMSSFFSGESRRTAFRVLATFPRPPAEFASFLWEIALGTSKTERPLAQACLVNHPNREKLIIQSLGDGRKEVRTASAEWLGRLKEENTIEPIRKALEKEKHDEPKAAMMEALEKLGVDIDQFLNRKKLLEEAKKGITSAVPADLKWFPFDQLPEVHWEKNKQTVPSEIIRWFVIQAFKVKKVEPGPLQRRYFAMMREDERRALGKFVLESWLTHDTQPLYTPAQAEQEADKATAQEKSSYQAYPQLMASFDEAQTRKRYLNHYLNHSLGSGSASRGVLSVAAACCGAEVVPRVEKYIRFWYGQRLTQVKGLIQFLAWLDQPLAIQVLLAIGTRFRTKAVQKEAVDCTDRLAERKGWTREELADRTVPTADFARDGTQVIDYGARQFSAKLMEDFSVELRNGDGKVINALPDASKTEDEAEIKSLKKDFSASKKELKQVLKLQHERLYEAMCTQRRWPYDEWEAYLNTHPIVGRYCQRLVWLAYRNDELVGTFRPLPDGSLTDHDDNTVTLDAADQIQVAHETLMSATDATKWQEHLKDYEVENLFAQFGKKKFEFTAELAKATEIVEFDGHLVNSFKLRSRTGKLGYVRGSAEDGGWFYIYNKQFTGLKMQATIEFTGNTLPEEDRTVALRKLYFVRMQDSANDSSGYTHRPMKLSEVPSVMLTECWNDIKLMASDGSGYSKDWEKTSAY